MKIYTRTGDSGETSLFAGGRTSKDATRLHAYGTIDELNSVLGLALAQHLSEQVSLWLAVIQNELFVVGSDLATPLEADVAWVTRITDSAVNRLEHEIDVMDGQLPPLKNFILPGGTAGTASLHLARTVCRRAERWIVTLSQQEGLNPLLLPYVNRLSDWLFTAARYENLQAGREETVWTKP
ncbi:MAG: cob(I)yrinic acid a,c-diamide adenosyltransferase [Chloroflexota bacterium]